MVSTVFFVFLFLPLPLPLSRVVLMKRNTYMQRLVFSKWVKVPSSVIADSSSCIRSRLKVIIRIGIRVLCHAETELVPIAGFRGMWRIVYSLNRKRTSVFALWTTTSSLGAQTAAIICELLAILGCIVIGTLLPTHFWSVLLLLLLLPLSLLSSLFFLFVRTWTKLSPSHKYCFHPSPKESQTRAVILLAPSKTPSL